MTTASGRIDAGGASSPAAGGARLRLSGLTPDAGGFDGLLYLDALVDGGWLARLKPAQVSVLLALIRYANDHGQACPSNLTLQKHTGISDRTVQRAIESLKAAGLAEEGGMHPRYRTRVLVLQPPPTPDASPETPPGISPGSAPAIAPKLASEGGPGAGPGLDGSPTRRARGLERHVGGAERHVGGTERHVGVTERHVARSMFGVVDNNNQEQSPPESPPEISRDASPAGLGADAEDDPEGGLWAAVQPAERREAASVLIAAGVRARQARGLVSQHGLTRAQAENVVANAAWHHGRIKGGLTNRGGWIVRAVQDGVVNLEPGLLAERDAALREARRAKSAALERRLAEEERSAQRRREAQDAKTWAGLDASTRDALLERALSGMPPISADLLRRARARSGVGAPLVRAAVLTQHEQEQEVGDA